MKLYHFELGLDYDFFSRVNNELRYEFQCRVEFICDYITKALRKKKIETKGKYNGIYINLLPDSENRVPIVRDCDVVIYLPFNFKKYNEARRLNDYNYYFELIRSGLYIYSNFLNERIDVIIDIVFEFEKINCKNRWLQKRRKFPSEDISVELWSELTTSNYTAEIEIKDKENVTICNGCFLKTEACHFVYYGLVSDIKILNNTLYIVDKWGNKRFSFCIPYLKKGLFFVKKEHFDNDIE